MSVTDLPTGLVRPSGGRYSQCERGGARRGQREGAGKRGCISSIAASVPADNIGVRSFSDGNRRRSQAFRQREEAETQRQNLLHRVDRTLPTCMRWSKP